MLAHLYVKQKYLSSTIVGKANRDTYSKPPWALRVPMKAEDRYPYGLLGFTGELKYSCALFQMRQHII